MIETTPDAPTVSDALAAASVRLAGAGVPEPRADAEVLVAHVLGTTRPGLVVHGRDRVEPDALRRLDTVLAARARRVPVWHLVGRREFWSLSFDVDARVLTPRPETEELVEATVALAPPGGVVVDAGTGSGAIAIAVARERPDLCVLALDVDQGALALAARNRRRLAPGVGLVCASWLDAVRHGTVDVVVSNPPYVTDAELLTLEPEVRDHEPRRALAGGPDGLAEVRRLVASAVGVLCPGGWLVMEFGRGQADGVRAALATPGWEAPPEIRTDLAGVERVAIARRSPAWT